MNGTNQTKQVELVSYVRNRKRQKIGLILARNDHGVVRLGWSQVNRKLGDKFDLATGLAWARSRMIAPVAIPKNIDNGMARMRIRSTKYFKGCVGEWEGDTLGFVAKGPAKTVAKRTTAKKVVKRMDCEIVPKRIPVVAQGLFEHLDAFDNRKGLFDALDSPR